MKQISYLSSVFDDRLSVIGYLSSVNTDYSPQSVRHFTYPPDFNHNIN